MERHFKAFIEDQKLPGKLEIEAVLDQEPVLKGRTWQNIKDFCRNAHLGVHVFGVCAYVCECAGWCLHLYLCLMEPHLCPPWWSSDSHPLLPLPPIQTILAGFSVILSLVRVGTVGVWVGTVGDDTCVGAIM